MSKQRAPAQKPAEGTKTGSGLTPKEWTIMVYMAGDNNLSEDMIGAIEAIKTGVQASMAATPPPDSNNVAFLVQYDGDHPLVPTYQIDLTYEGGRTYDPMASRKPIPAADESKKTEEKIRLFVKWAVKKRPANNYAVILSGHSDGFRGRTFLLDDDPQSVATLQELAKKLGEAIDELRKDSLDLTLVPPVYFPKDKFDLICFDSCVMNNLEIMYEFKDCAVAWIGSQGSIPNYTWNYLGIAQELSKEKRQDLTLGQVATTIIDQVKKYNDPYAFQGRSIDISVAKLRDIDDLTIPFLTFTLSLLKISYLSAPPTWLSNYWSRMLADAHLKCQTFMCNQSIDLWDYCDCLASICASARTEIRSINNAPPQPVQDFLDNLRDLESEIGTLKAAVDNFIFDKRTVGGDCRFARGVSVFSPWALLAFLMSVTRYAELNHVRNTVPGLLWTIYIAVQLLLSARPEIPLGSITLPPNILTMTAPSFAKARSLATGMTSIDVLNILNQILSVLGPGQGVRDAPPKTRGMDEYLEYFRNTKNFRPDLNP